MRRLLEIREYREDVESVARLDLPWESLCGKTLLVTGGTGLIGSFLIDVLSAAKLGCRVILFGRCEEKARNRFAEYWGTNFMKFVSWDAMSSELPMIESSIDFVLHLASNTHPIAYATDPIGTIVANVIVLNNLLSFAASSSVSHPRFLFASSNEIYGENRGDVELFNEEYCGYINCNTLRAGYPESKRCGEALCQAYIKQKNLDCVIARLTRTYGPTILPSDTKVISQFFRNALNHEDIVLKSAGNQFFSYQYVADSVAGLLTILLKGKKGEAYNVAAASSDITLCNLARLIANQSGQNVIFQLPNEVESLGFSRATKARLSGAKLNALGWNSRYTIGVGIARCFEIMRKCYR